MNKDEELARQRFMLLNLVRLVGLACVFAGIANVAGKFLADLAPWLGYFLIVSGAADFFLAPAILKKSWRTPEA